MTMMCGTAARFVKPDPVPMMIATRTPVRAVSIPVFIVGFIVYILGVAVLLFPTTSEI